MKIISGTLGRRNIQTLPGDATRPTSSKVRGAIFNALGQFFDGGLVLDLFAGSGAMGIEAISRGCDRAIFVDSSQQAIKVIRQNVETLNITERVSIMKSDFSRVLDRMTGETFELIFVDPPYHMEVLEEIMRQVQERKLLASKGCLILEYSNKTYKELSFDTSYFEIKYSKKYDATSICILQKI